MNICIKKFFLCISVLFILTGCITPNRQETQIEEIGKEYIEKIINYQSRDKNVDNVIDNEEFKTFCNEIFKDSISVSYISLHYSIKDYRKYGIEKPELTLGDVEYSFDKETYDVMVEELEQLQSFDFDSLSYNQQYDYEVMEYSYYESIACLCYYRYDYVFSSSSSVVDNLISEFSDFTFYDEESIDDYLVLLADIDRFFDDCLVYTEAQANDHIYLHDEWIDDAVEKCEAVQDDDNDFIVSFNERINELDFIDDEKKKEYIETNEKIVRNEVLPAYEKVKNNISKYYGKLNTSDEPLYKLDRNYAKLRYIIKSSYGSNIDSMFNDLLNALNDIEANLISVIYDDNKMDVLDDVLSNRNEVLNLSRYECLEYIKDNMYKYYPIIDDVEYSISDLNPKTAPTSVIAYYFPSPIDEKNQNIIRVNPNKMNEGFETYSTLAHEGIPGHLYQHVYFTSNYNNEFREIFDFIGYGEGWAVDSQYYSYLLALDDEELAYSLFYLINYYFIVYSILDICINYYGYSMKKTGDIINSESRFVELDNGYLEVFGSTYSASFVYDYPVSYIPYGVGYTQMYRLRNKAKKALGNAFDEVSFNELLLKNGPLSFNILEKAVDQYIEEH